jgi:hypothetical protein
MARPKGTKVIPCPNRKCAGKIVAKPGATGVCSSCGEKVKFTASLLKELGKK